MISQSTIDEVRSHFEGRKRQFRKDELKAECFGNLVQRYGLSASSALLLLEDLETQYSGISAYIRQLQEGDE